MRTKKKKKKKDPTAPSFILHGCPTGFPDLLLRAPCPLPRSSFAFPVTLSLDVPNHVLFHFLPSSSNSELSYSQFLVNLSRFDMFEKKFEALTSLALSFRTRFVSSHSSFDRSCHEFILRHRSQLIVCFGSTQADYGASSAASVLLGSPPALQNWFPQGQIGNTFGHSLSEFQTSCCYFLLAAHTRCLDHPYRSSLEALKHHFGLNLSSIATYGKEFQVTKVVLILVNGNFWVGKFNCSQALSADLLQPVGFSSWGSIGFLGVSTEPHRQTYAYALQVSRLPHCYLVDLLWLQLLKWVHLNFCFRLIHVLHIYLSVVKVGSLFSCSSHGYSFITLFVVVTGLRKLGIMTLSNYGIQLHSASSLSSSNWFCQLELLLVFSLSLFMVRGHKDHSLWPKASTLNNLFGSVMCLICCYRGVFNRNCLDYVPKNNLVILNHFSHPLFVHKCTNLGCNVLYSWKFMLHPTQYLSWGNVETPCKSFPRPSLLRLQIDRIWFQDIISESVHISACHTCDDSRLTYICPITVLECHSLFALLFYRTNSLSFIVGLERVLVRLMLLGACHPCSGRRRHRLETDPVISSFFCSCYSSVVLSCFFGHGSEGNFCDARMSLPWRLEFSSFSPLRTQVQDDTNIPLLSTKTTNLASLLIQGLKFLMNSLCLGYALFLDALYMYFDIFHATVSQVQRATHSSSRDVSYQFFCSLIFSICKWWKGVCVSLVPILYTISIFRNFFLVSGIKLCRFFPKAILPTDLIDQMLQDARSLHRNNSNHHLFS